MLDQGCVADGTRLVGCNERRRANIGAYLTIHIRSQRVGEQLDTGRCRVTAFDIDAADAVRLFVNHQQTPGSIFTQGFVLALLWTLFDANVDAVALEHNERTDVGW